MHIRIKNFSHPITELQKQELTSILAGVTNEPVTITVDDYQFHVDFSGNIVDQARAVFETAYSECTVSNGMLVEDDAIVFTRPPALTEGTLLAAIYLKQTFNVFPIIPAFKTVRGLTQRFELYAVFDFNRPDNNYAFAL